MATLIKICGVRSARDAIAAAKSGADLIGFNFIPKNMRNVTPDAAEEIVTEVKRASEKLGFAAPKFVGVFMDAGEKLLAEPAHFLSYFQFHGHESPERVKEIGSEYGVDMIKVVSARSEADLPAADEFANAADLLLLSARATRPLDPPQTSPAGTQWGFIRQYRGNTPFLLAGGLDSESVKEAIAHGREVAAFAGVDASSGLEGRPGEKDPAKIVAFIKAARGAARGAM